MKFLAALLALTLWVPWAGASHCIDFVKGAPKAHFKKTTLKLNDIQLEEAIRDSGLLPAELEIVRRHSLGLIDIYDLLGRNDIKGFILGVVDGYGVYHAVARTMSLKDWWDGYQALDVSPDAEDHTELYMEKLTQGDRQVVFLVPPNFWKHESGKVTKREMRWLLDHPERMKNVLFVFGGLNVVDDKAWMEMYFEAAQTGRNLESEHLSLEDNLSIMMSRALRTAAARHRPHPAR